MSCTENACKKSELVQAINTYGNARASGDPNLITFAGNLIAQFIETLAFAPEDEPVEDEALAEE